MILITTLVVSLLVCSMLEVQPGHYSSLTAPNLQHTANQELNDQRGNQHHSRELLMMGIVMPETCCAYKKYNKLIANQELYDQCGNQHHSRELLMMGIVVLETC